jgi:Protein of unknown function (DUF4244)
MSWPISTDQGGHTTAEYAIGTTAACAFAGMLAWFAASSWYAALLRQLLEVAMLMSHVPRFIL